MKHKTIPIVNPNYRRVANSIVFSLDINVKDSIENVVTIDDIDAFDAIDGKKPLEMLLDMYPNSSRTFDILYMHNIIDFISNDLFLNRKKQVVIIEAHMDDAALSIGGGLLKNMHESKYTLISVFTESNYTKKSYSHEYDIEFVKELRLKESELFCRRIGAEHFLLHEKDQPIRTRSRMFNDLPNAEETNTLADKMFDIIRHRKVNEVWFPLGLDFHADHHRTRDVIITMLNKYRDFFLDADIYLYEDLPYINSVCYHTFEKILTVLYGECKRIPFVVDIENYFSEKQRLVKIYASQYNTYEMMKDIEYCARNCDSRYMYSERSWLFNHRIMAFDYKCLIPKLDLDYLCKELSTRNVLHFIYDDYFVPKDFETLCELFPHLFIHLIVSENTNFLGFQPGDKVSIQTYTPNYDIKQKYSKIIELTNSILLLNDSDFIIVTSLVFREKNLLDDFDALFNKRNLISACWFSAVIKTMKDYSAGILK